MKSFIINLAYSQQQSACDHQKQKNKNKTEEQQMIII